MSYTPNRHVQSKQICHGHLLVGLTQEKLPSPPQCLLLQTMGQCTFAKALQIMTNVKNNARAAGLSQGNHGQVVN